MKKLEFQRVSFAPKNRWILSDISFSLDKGEVLAITGPSGSGKSTILRIAAGLSAPDGGKVLLDGIEYEKIEPTALRRRVGLCFQTPWLFDQTVKDNLSFVYEARRRAPETGRMEELLEEFGLGGFLEKDVMPLSGGEKQRVSLVRSLLADPEVLLLDEATSALDVENVKIVEDAIARRAERGLGVLWVTHDPAQSRRVASRILRIEGGKLVREEAVR